MGSSAVVAILLGVFGLVVGSLCHCGTVDGDCPHRDCPVRCTTRTEAWLALYRCPTYDDAGNRVDAGTDHVIGEGCPAMELYGSSCFRPVETTPECARIIPNSPTYVSDSDQCCYPTAPEHCE
jgi:hypothetical protein